jgi:prephenate dehydrogenase
MKFAGKGFIDTSRIASGPANIWTDVLMTNTKNISTGIDRVIEELVKLKKAVAGEDEKNICCLLEKARKKREALIKHKFEKKELL